MTFLFSWLYTLRPPVSSASAACKCCIDCGWLRPKHTHAIYDEDPYQTAINSGWYHIFVLEPEQLSAQMQSKMLTAGGLCRRQADKTRCFSGLAVPPASLQLSSKKPLQRSGEITRARARTFATASARPSLPVKVSALISPLPVSNDLLPAYFQAACAICGGNGRAGGRAAPLPGLACGARPSGFAAAAAPFRRPLGAPSFARPGACSGGHGRWPPPAAAPPVAPGPSGWPACLRGCRPTPPHSSVADRRALRLADGKGPPPAGPGPGLLCEHGRACTFPLTGPVTLPVTDKKKFWY